MVNPIGKAKKGRGKQENINRHKFPVPQIVLELIDRVDIVLEVLDSRFIEKTRNPEIEKILKGQGKRIIYVFNKSDLVDIDKIKKEVELWALKPGLFVSSRERKGSGVLKKLIKIEANKIGKDLVNIGVIGYPNSGKSSLINYLVGRSVSRTSSEAGYTKGIQKIKISDGIYLIDTPGVIPPSEKSGNMLLKKHPQIGAVTWDKTRNPEIVVHKIMQEFPGVLERHYEVESNNDSEIFIEKLGRKLSFLKKGNLVDEQRTAQKVLKDWQEGTIFI
jgi:hypothetical protein